MPSVAKSVKMLKGEICCFWMAESLSHFILAKKSIISKVVNELDAELPFFTNLSQELKKVAYLYVMNDKSYGQLVNDKDIPVDAIIPELYRMLENHQLWERRYILSQVN